jgi:hypothetical protein
MPEKKSKKSTPPPPAVVQHEWPYAGAYTRHGERGPDVDCDPDPSPDISAEQREEIVNHARRTHNTPGYVLEQERIRKEELEHARALASVRSEAKPARSRRPLPLNSYASRIAELRPVIAQDAEEAGRNIDLFCEFMHRDGVPVHPAWGVTRRKTKPFAPRSAPLRAITRLVPSLISAKIWNAERRSAERYLSAFRTGQGFSRLVRSALAILQLCARFTSRIQPMTKIVQPDVPGLLEKATENLRIDSAFLRMKSRDAAESSDSHAADVLSEASTKAFRLAAAFERLQRNFERGKLPQTQRNGWLCAFVQENDLSFFWKLALARGTWPSADLVSRPLVRWQAGMLGQSEYCRGFY